MKSFARRVRPARFLGALAAVAALALGGCASTVSSISVPSSSPWRMYRTTIITPAGDLAASATGTGITASLPESPVPFILCNSDVGKFFAPITGDPAGWTEPYQVSQCAGTAPAGAGTIASLGVFYGSQVKVELTDAFVAGGVQVTSTSSGPLFGFSINRSAADGKMSLVAGVSPAVFGGLFATDFVGPGTSSNVFLQYGFLAMEPRDPNFASAALCADGTVPNSLQGCPSGPATIEGIPLPVLVCDQTDESDRVYFYTGEARSASLTCGTVPIAITLNGGYRSLGECVSTNIRKFCASTKLTGKDRVACNQAQTGACQATFNVPSRLNPNR